LVDRLRNTDSYLGYDHLFYLLYNKDNLQCETNTMKMTKNKRVTTMTRLTTNILEKGNSKFNCSNRIRDLHSEDGTRILLLGSGEYGYHVTIFSVSDTHTLKADPNPDTGLWLNTEPGSGFMINKPYRNCNYKKNYTYGIISWILSTVLPVGQQGQPTG